MAVFNLIFPGPDNRNIEVSASSGSFLFVVGANGSGKSTLMHHFSRQYANSIRRLSAHRQVWLQSDTVDLTPAGRQQNETNIQARDTRPESRYRDDQAPVRTQMVMFDILDAENVQNKKIATAFKSNNIEDLERFRGTRSPLDNINTLWRWPIYLSKYLLEKEENFSCREATIHNMVSTSFRMGKGTHSS